MVVHRISNEGWARPLLGITITILVCVLSALAQTPPADTITWSSIGPRNAGTFSGKINAFEYVQSNPQIMYIGGGWGNTPRESPSQAGVYVTNDGGTTWTAVDNGLTKPDGTISSVVNGLWLDQDNPSTVLASTEFGGTFKSTDGGATWKNVDRSESTRFALLGSILYVATRKGVLASTDDGSTWTVSLSLTNGATTVVTAAGALFAGSTDGDVYQFENSAWAKLGHPGQGPIHDLAVDPFNAKTVYSNVDDQSAWNQNLYGSIDGGNTWKQINCRCSIGAQAIAFSNVTKDRLYVGDDGSGSILYFKADGNPNPAISTGAYGTLDVRYIVPVPGNQKTEACYVLQDQGLFYTPTCISGGVNGLNPQVNDMLSYDVAVSPDGKNVLATLQDNGSISSSNGGKTWGGGIGSGEGGEAYYHPDNSGYCYIAHPDEGLYISTNKCAAFGGSGSTGFESLTFDPSNPDVLYAVTGESSGAPVVSKSSDKGATWSAAGWNFTNPYQVEVAPSDAKSFVVTTGTATSPSSLFYSHDGGETWNKSKGLPTKEELPPSEMWYPVHRFYAAFDPRNANTILLADHDPKTDNILIYKSTNGGATFTHVRTFIQPKPPRHWPLLFHPWDDTPIRKKSFYYTTRFYGNRVVFNREAKSGDPDVLVTTRFGAFLSADLGKTWSRIDKTAIAHDFIGATWNQGHVYLASFGQGLIRSDQAIQP